jgi:hypothetical protein
MKMSRAVVAGGVVFTVVVPVTVGVAETPGVEVEVGLR